jgi:hypothetical protein
MPIQAHFGTLVFSAQTVHSLVSGCIFALAHSKISVYYFVMVHSSYIAFFFILGLLCKNIVKQSLLPYSPYTTAD